MSHKRTKDYKEKVNSVLICSGQSSVGSVTDACYIPLKGETMACLFDCAVSCCDVYKFCL